MRLRHHRGALHTVPFGEIAHFTDQSHDWAIMKPRFRVPVGADIEQIRKMFKRIGWELLKHPEIEDDLIQPFKSRGILEVEECGLIISVRFTSKPVLQFTIRRYAYRTVQEAFAAAGIGFATPDVRVDEEEDLIRNKTSAGEVKSVAAAQLTTQPRPTLQA